MDRAEIRRFRCVLVEKLSNAAILFSTNEVELFLFFVNFDCDFKQLYQRQVFVKRVFILEVHVFNKFLFTLLFDNNL